MATKTKPEVNRIDEVAERLAELHRELDGHTLRKQGLALQRTAAEADHRGKRASRRTLLPSASLAALGGPAGYSPGTLAAFERWETEDAAHQDVMAELTAGVIEADRQAKRCWVEIHDLRREHRALQRQVEAAAAPGMADTIAALAEAEQRVMELRQAVADVDARQAQAVEAFDSRLASELGHERNDLARDLAGAEGVFFTAKLAHLEAAATKAAAEEAAADLVLTEANHALNAATQYRDGCLALARNASNELREYQRRIRELKKTRGRHTAALAAATNGSH